MDPKAKVPHVYTEDREKQHIAQVAQGVSQATNTQVTPEQTVPVKNQNPTPQILHPLNEHMELGLEDISKDEIGDIVEGLQGKPRTANAVDFLKDKLSWLKKKHGTENVQLVKK